jgi:hypothetical protein
MTATANKPTRNRKSKKTAQTESLTMNMQTTAEIDLSANSEALLGGLLEDLVNMDDKPVADEIDLSDADLSDADLSDADLSDLEGLSEPVLEAAVPADAPVLAASEDLVGEVSLEGLEGADLDDAALASALADIEAAGGVTEPAAEQPAETEAAEKPAKAKEPKVHRVTYVTGKASDVLTARLGDKRDEMLLLETADIELEPDALRAKQADLLALLNTRPGTGSATATQKKVAEKVVMLFTWMKSGGSLNEVMKRTFKVLLRDGCITSGEKGNLHAELLSKPYSKGTCNAQAGQMMAMLPMLKIAVSTGEKGRLVLNADSLIAMKVKADLGL